MAGNKPDVDTAADQERTMSLMPEVTDKDLEVTPLLFDVNHAALLLGICVSTLRRETMIGRMPCARVGPGGRAIRYSLEHVQEYIKRCDDDGKAT